MRIAIIVVVTISVLANPTQPNTLLSSSLPPSAEDGILVAVDVLGSVGGVLAQQGASVTVFGNGEWAALSPLDTQIPSGYFHLTTLKTTSIAALGCNMGIFGLVKTEVASLVREREAKADADAAAWAGRDEWSGVESNRIESNRIE